MKVNIAKLARDLMVESENVTIERYGDYLEKEDWDLIDIIRTYLLVKFRDNVSLEASDNDSMRSRLKRYFDTACTKITINKNDILKELSTLHNEHRNDKNHYDIMTSKIEEIIYKLRELNNMGYTPIKSIIEQPEEIEPIHLDNEAENLCKLIDEKLKERNIMQNWSNIPLKNNYIITEWTNGEPSNTVHCDRVFMVTDKVGDREHNIGCYYGKTSNGLYALSPQGVKYLNNLFNTYEKSTPMFFTNRDEFINTLITMIERFYNLKYNSNSSGIA